MENVENNENGKRLLFEEIKKLEVEINDYSISTSKKSIYFWWVNTAFVVSILTCSSCITAVPIFTKSQIPSILLGIVITLITGIDLKLKLSSKGYFYKQATKRLKKTKQQIRDIVYMFQKLSIEQILASLNSIRTEFDDIDMDLYKTSIAGDKFEENNRNIIPIPQNSESNISNPNTPTHIHIHMDSPNSSSNSSPNSSPYVVRKNSFKPPLINVDDSIV